MSHNVACSVDQAGRIDQAGLDLTGLFLPLPPKCWADTWLWGLRNTVRMCLSAAGSYLVLSFVLNMKWRFCPLTHNKESLSRSCAQSVSPSLCLCLSLCLSLSFSTSLTSIRESNWFLAVTNVTISSGMLWAFSPSCTKTRWPEVSMRYLLESGSTSLLGWHWSSRLAD